MCVIYLCVYIYLSVERGLAFFLILSFLEKCLHFVKPYVKVDKDGYTRIDCVTFLKAKIKKKELQIEKYYYLLQCFGPQNVLIILSAQK